MCNFDVLVNHLLGESKENNENFAKGLVATQWLLEAVS
jgi:hypothetical protein